MQYIAIKGYIQVIRISVELLQKKRTQKHFLTRMAPFMIGFEGIVSNYSLFRRLSFAYLVPSAIEPTGLSEQTFRPGLQSLCSGRPPAFQCDMRPF